MTAAEQFTTAWTALQGGVPEEAERLCRLALAAEPGRAEGWFLLGAACHIQGRLADAADGYRRALALQPCYPDAMNNLGSVLSDLDRPGEAADCFQQALALRPDFAEAHNNLGNARRDMGRSAEAAECYRRALQLRPDLSGARLNLGAALLDIGRPGEAEGCFRETLQRQPNWREAFNNLGSALMDLGRLDEAVACFRRAVQQWPDYVLVHDSLLYALHYRAGVTLADLAVEHAEYELRHAAPLRAAWRSFANSRDTERPLRLGFVSADFGRHAVGFLLVRTIEALAQRQCAVLCYSDRRAAPDDLTARFRSAAAVWRDTARLSDERLAELVRADGVDVLIDLAGHTAGNRLLTFARRPAPVLCSWLGYVGTTGLQAMDYLIADNCQVLAGSEKYYRERVLRLPGGYATYDPPMEAPDPGPPPALASGRVTFGCFNNPAKLSPPTLAMFTDVLRRVPGSRMIFKYRGMDDSTVTDRVKGAFAAAGMGAGRVEMRGHTDQASHLAAYRDVDIALDPFPYSGGVTTCDALWMGVPVVTLPGETFASRHSLSHLSGVGLAELAATDVEGYVTTAIALAGGLDRLTQLRAELRPRMARSPLCDGGRLADELLAALRGAWREWVATQ